MARLRRGFVEKMPQLLRARCVQARHDRCEVNLSVVPAGTPSAAESPRPLLRPLVKRARII